MPPRAMRAVTAYRPSTTRPTRGSRPAATARSLGAVLLPQGEHVRNIPAGVVVEAVLPDRGQPLVVGGDGGLLGGRCPQGGEDRDAGGDVVPGVEEVELPSDEPGRPSPGRRDDLHDADRVRGGDPALVEARLLGCDREREGGVQAVPARTVLDDGHDLRGTRRRTGGQRRAVRAGGTPDDGGAGGRDVGGGRPHGGRGRRRRPREEQALAGEDDVGRVEVVE